MFGLLSIRQPFSRIVLIGFVIESFAYNARLFADESEIQQAVVKIYSENRVVNLSAPWSKKPPNSVSGSGVVIAPNRILTNAHVVLFSSQVTVQAFDSSDRIPAKAVFIAPGIDLAILEFSPQGSLEKVKPLVLASSSPAVKTTVRVYGYPTGGDSQSVTEGIISRIEYTNYRYGVHGKRIQIDAAMNPGNSGGPAIVDGKIAGLAFSTRAGANDIGYVIPTEEIRLFQKDIEDGKYDGKPQFRIESSYLENSALRRYLKVPSSVTGVVCRGTMQMPDSPLKPGDILTQIDGNSIDNRGNCRISDGMTVSFNRLAAEAAKDGMVQIKIWRDGKEESLSVPVDTRENLLPHIAGRYPRYFVYGPVIFSHGTADFVETIDAGIASSDTKQRAASVAVSTIMKLSQSPLVERRQEKRSDPTEELVIVTGILTHDTARGYKSIPYPFTVKSINGVAIKNLRQAVDLLKATQEEFVVIDFFDTIADRIVLDRKQAEEATETILDDNGIGKQGSPELLTAKP